MEDYFHHAETINIDVSRAVLEGDEPDDLILGRGSSSGEWIKLQSSSDADWFIDPTPYDHSEFDLTDTSTVDGWWGQRLYRDLAPTHQAPPARSSGASTARAPPATSA